MGKPVLLIYRQQSDGIGKLLQCLMVCRSLRQQFLPVVMNSGPLPDGIEVPDGVEVVQMPGCSHLPEPGIFSPQRALNRQCDRADRREFILQILADLNPIVLMIDTFPFGDASLADDLIPLLEQAKNRSGGSPYVVCCLQDIQRFSGFNPQKRDDRTAELLENYFDMVLVHTDPAFARLEEFFQPRNTLSIPVHYTGFLVPRQNIAAVAGVREERLLVSAGGGATGRPLFHAALEAQRLLWAAQRLPMTIVTGPLVTKKEWSEMQLLSEKSHALTIKRSVPNMGAEMRKVHWSISQCGYGTATETIASRVAALFVPSRGSRNLEQMDRARRLAHWGVGRLLVHEHLNGASLANEIVELVRFMPRETGFSMAGLACTVSLINKLVLGSNAHMAPQVVGSNSIH